jgi:pimeloyl-ACP methyl ester carboxylesterase
MAKPLPVVLIPGLNCSARLYAEQIPALWRFGPVQVADHTRDDSMDAIAKHILAAAPPRFALAGFSMGGYLALTIVRHAPERVQRLALLDTSARPETPEQTARRKPQIALIRRGAGAAVSGIRPSQPARRRSAARARAPHGRGNRSAGVLAPAASDHDAF